MSGFYQFALMIGGVLAFGAIVYGGILYAASAGNPSKQSEGKEWIKSALFGLLLLAGAYLILYTINPNLVNLGLPTLQSVNIQTPSVGANCTSPSFACGQTCCVPPQTCASQPGTGNPVCLGQNPLTAPPGSCNNGVMCGGVCCLSPKSCTVTLGSGSVCQ